MEMEISKRTKDIVGNRYGRLVVLSFAGYMTKKDGVREATWECLCDCGNVKIAQSSSLKSLRTSSCGCLHSEVARKTCIDNTKTHGLSGTREYNIWAGIKQRCYDTNCESYFRYGGNGIVMDEDFVNDFEAFLSYVGPAPSNKHSIDRIDRNKGYIKGNIRWATAYEQARNKGLHRNNTSGVNGVTLRTYCDGSTYWVAVWSEVTAEGKKIRKGKAFSIKKFGNDLAFEMACKFREERISYLNTLGYGYTEDHGKLTKENI